MPAPKGRGGRLQRGALSPLRLDPSHHLSSRGRVAHPFREPLQFIVTSVMGVMSGTCPHTYGVFCMTVNCWCIRGPSRHRHVHRHRGKGLGKRLPRYRDGDDAHDDDLRAFSRQGAPSLLRRPSYPFKLPDEPDAVSKESLTYAIFEVTSGVGFV